MDTEWPVADIGGSLVVAGRPVTDKVGLLAVIRNPPAGTGGPLASLDPLADTTGQATWEASWMSQEPVWSTQDARGVPGRSLTDTRG